MTDASKTLQAATGTLNGCTTQRGKAQAELGTTSDQLIQTRQHLSLIQEVRRVEQENYSRAAVVSNDALRALEDCQDLANQLLKGTASLAQLTDHTGKMIKQAVHLGKTAAYSAVFASLARLSLAEEVNVSDVERLQALLETLR